MTPEPIKEKDLDPNRGWYDQQDHANDILPGSIIPVFEKIEEVKKRRPNFVHHTFISITAQALEKKD